MLLGPTITAHRTVTNGRNFECYSEDPELAADLPAYITGLQEMVGRDGEAFHRE